MSQQTLFVRAKTSSSLKNSNVRDANTAEEKKKKDRSQNKHQGYILYDDFLEEKKTNLTLNKMLNWT